MRISPEHYLLDWFLTAFSRALPLDTASRIWDCFMLEGEVFLYRTALGILAASKRKLKKANFEECVMTLRNLPSDVSADTLFESIGTITVPSYINDFIYSIQKDL